MSTKLRLLALAALDPLPDAPTEMWPEPEECLNENGDYR